MDQALEIQNLEKVYPAGKQVIKGINWSLAADAKVAIWGENGAGKTTLLRMIANLLSPSSGAIHFRGHNYEKFPTAMNSQIGWVPTLDKGMFHRLTGKENLQVFAGFYRLDKKVFNQKLRPWLEIPIFEEALATPYFRCSSGMKHLLALAKTCLHSPKMLLLDEPTRALSPKAAQLAKQVILDNFSRDLIILATHSNQEAEIANSHYNLKEGQLEIFNPPPS